MYRQVAVLTWQVSLASMGTTPWSVITARFSSLAIYSTYLYRCAQVYRQVAVLTWQVSRASMGTTPWSVMTTRFSSSLAIYSTYLYRCAQVCTGVHRCTGR